jgi:NTP pyrophosphatase (non-canonical NTP hydrolase)
MSSSGPQQNGIIAVMDFKEYQARAWETAMHPNAGDNYLYPTLGLAGEAGEIANKVKKIQRDRGGVIDDEVREMVKGELGDLLWYAACLATELKLDFNVVAEENIAKLASRKERGTLHGDGDKR